MLLVAFFVFMTISPIAAKAYETGGGGSSTVQSRKTHYFNEVYRDVVAGVELEKLVIKGYFYETTYTDGTHKITKVCIDEVYVKLPGAKDVYAHVLFAVWNKAGYVAEWKEVSYDKVGDTLSQTANKYWFFDDSASSSRSGFIKVQISLSAGGWYRIPGIPYDVPRLGHGITLNWELGTSGAGSGGGSDVYV